MQGKPCVNVLHKNWKPVFTIQTVIFALMFLFTDPNPQDPLNIGTILREKPNNDHVPLNIYEIFVAFVMYLKKIVRHELIL